MWTEADQEWLDASLNLIDANMRVRESDREYRRALVKMIVRLFQILTLWALLAPSVAH